MCTNHEDWFKYICQYQKTPLWEKFRIDYIERDSPRIIQENMIISSLPTYLLNNSFDPRKHPKINTRKITTVELGYALITEQDIPVNGYIGEYLGEVITNTLKDQRKANKYCFELEISNNSYSIDATIFRNQFAYMNHSCDPNVYALCLVHSNLPHLYFFAAKNIQAGDTLTVDYFPDKKILVKEDLDGICKCGSVKCRKEKNKK